MVTFEKLRKVLLVTGCLTVLPGCTHLFWLTDLPQSQVKTTEAETLSPSRENLIVSLRHNPDYGLIAYGNHRVLFRDLTKPHPSVRDGKTPMQELAGTKQPTRLPADWVSTGVGVVARSTAPDSGIGFKTGDVEDQPRGQLTTTNENPAIAVSKIDDRINPEQTVVLPAPEHQVKDVDLNGCHGSSGGHVRPHDEKWLAGRDGDHWTIQLVSSRDATEPCIDNYLREIKTPEAHRHVVFFQNALWNVAVVGEYETAEAALKAATKFDRPWVRQIGEFRRKRCNSVRYMSAKLQATLNRWCQEHEYQIEYEYAAQ